MNLSLAGTVLVVTGSTQGVGRATTGAVVSSTVLILLLDVLLANLLLSTGT